jgi:hypothetical protein
MKKEKFVSCCNTKRKNVKKMDRNKKAHALNPAAELPCGFEGVRALIGVWLTQSVFDVL